MLLAHESGVACICVRLGGSAVIMLLLTIQYSADPSQTACWICCVPITDVYAGPIHPGELQPVAGDCGPSTMPVTPAPASAAHLLDLQSKGFKVAACS